MGETLHCWNTTEGRIKTLNDKLVRNNKFKDANYAIEKLIFLRDYKEV